MTTIYFSHQSFLEHDTGLGHPENADRLRAIERALAANEFERLDRRDAPRGTREQIRLIHGERYIDYVLDAVPQEGFSYLDGDTVVSPRSGEAALHAVGAACAAVDAVFAQASTNAFCAVRPPGHHAEPGAAMGFCLFNNVAIAAEYARKQHGIERVAIVDFDVHHGNGTQNAFQAKKYVMYASTHQFPWYPGTGKSEETGVGNIINVPLAAGSGSKEFRSAFVERILPALNRFSPELLLISAGFDAHRNDPLANLNLVEDDYAWVTSELMAVAEKHAEGRLVSVLEGGYNLGALGKSVAAHVSVLMGRG
ncbi:histone deacetylase family protein [Methylocaldum szegediense]|uniref:Acetoin utilization deacetylase AcuC-like enzyme n=1 Tax=Methylocaldum szegediense TaxID=73780 RepID=A0ABN8WXM6_9GAMM|nr:histone deacetylase family protein [Methylocaldum szegediense]CAI8747843.1 Acetoin utilization deacetylase AcuC-like enzyme [Methylocaldum szegediense]